MKDRQAILAQFETLLPLATEWCEAEEARALRDGVPLTAPQISDANAVGVAAPERIRLLRVESVPVPAHPDLRAAAEAIQFLSPETSGLTLQYAIFLRWDCWRDRDLIVHELVHTAQCERLGGILPFLRQYLIECLTIGYANSPMELEASAAAERVLGAPRA